MAPKRPPLDTDRLVGVRPRDRKDLFAGCNEPGKPWFHPDASVFMRTFCRICRNVDCVRAKGAVSPWLTRMQEQVDYLINNPQFSELDTPEHRTLAQMAFDALNAKAERLEIAARRQDWEIPEIPSDGVAAVASPSVTEDFDEAVKELARAKGRPEPDLPRPNPDTAPAHFVEAEEIEYETQYPSSEGEKTYRVALTKSGAWSCECDGFRHRGRCRHLETVRSWYEEQLRKAEETEARARPSPSPTSTPSGPRTPRPYNTPMPSGGVMVGGEPAPPARSPRPAPRDPPDPWAPKQDNVIQPGATVTLRGGRKP